MEDQRHCGEEDNVSLFLLQGVEDKNVESPILTLARSVDRVANELDLTKMAHTADLLWIVGELKSLLAHWGDGEISSAVTKEQVRHLATALDEKIKEY